MKFGQRLKEIRLSRNLTMTDVEARAGLKVGNISRIEKGTQWVSEDSLHAIARALDVPVATLFTEENSNSTSGYITFQRLNVQASAGAGSEPVEYPDVLQEIRVLESWARQTLGVVDPSRIKIITCKGDSMTPTVRPGDIVFVDISVRHFQAEGIYPDCYITDPWVDVKGQSVSFMPSVGTLAQWPELLHEWVGYAMYKWRGW